MANKKGAMITVNKEELVNSTFTDSAVLNKAVVARAGETKIEVLQDSDGNDYAKATYELKTPLGDRKEVSITNMELATRIERINKSIALGDVAYFVTAKELENITETDATELGFDNAVAMAVSIFGLGKSTVENYRRLSRFFIANDYTLIGAIPKDTPISTLNQLLSLVHIDEAGHHDISDVEKLFTSGIITPYMKQAELKSRLAFLKSQETEKRLSELSLDEVEALKGRVTADSADRKEKKKQEKKPSEAPKQASENKVTVSNNPQVLAGEALNKIKELKAIFEKMEIESTVLTPAIEAVEHYMEAQETENN